jgi:hypothetical protein
MVALSFAILASFSVGYHPTTNSMIHRDLSEPSVAIKE